MFACIAFVFRYAKFYVIKVMPCHGLVLHNFGNKLHDSHVCGEGRSQDARTKNQEPRHIDFNGLKRVIDWIMT